jgi:hypothetical protein
LSTPEVLALAYSFGLRHHVIERSPLRIIPYLNISFPGIFAVSVAVTVGECADLRLLDLPKSASETARGAQKRGERRGLNRGLVCPEILPHPSPRPRFPERAPSVSTPDRIPGMWLRIAVDGVSRSSF